MLAWIGVAVTVLASPTERQVTYSVSQEMVSGRPVSHAPERTASARVEELLSNLAVVRPGPGNVASMRLFVAVAPVSRHSMGVQAIGSF